MADVYDLLVKGGMMVDPSQEIHDPRDVALSEGKVAAVEKSIDTGQAKRVIDASGRIVTPGLIDLHAHVCYSITHLSLDPDPACLAKGTTTVLDVGSVGQLTFPGFRRYIIDACKTRVRALLNIGSLGLVFFFKDERWTELINDTFMTPYFINLEETVKMIKENRDVVLGVKWHSSYGLRALPWARTAADRTGSLLMCENHFQPETLRYMEKGDILTHTFHGLRTRGLLDLDGQVVPEVRKAIKRGVVLDVGHGVGSFSFKVAETALEQGIRPDTISTDLHIKNVNGPVFDLPTTMSKFLLLGLSLDEVTRAATARPAEVLGMAGTIGTLKVGASADVVVFRLAEGEFVFTDTLGQSRVGRQKLIPSTVIRGGEVCFSSS